MLSLDSLDIFRNKCKGERPFAPTSFVTNADLIFEDVYLIEYYKPCGTGILPVQIRACGTGILPMKIRTCDTGILPVKIRS